MLKSMTGYGEAQAVSGDFRVTVTARSLNNKGFKIDVVLPEGFNSVSSKIEEIARKLFRRGTVYIQAEVEEDKVAFELNEKVISSYYSQLSKIKKKLCSGCDLKVELLALLPGSITEKRRGRLSRCTHFTSVLLSAAEQAMTKLAQARSKEGEYLEKDILKRAEIISKALSITEKSRKDFLKKRVTKLSQRVKEILSEADVNLSNAEITKEAAILIERSDISEEIERLRIHLKELYAALKSPRPVGRRIEFIAQEMLREANTIASKSTDPDVVVHIIDMKSEIDRIREQSQNVE